jgi:type II secretory pathway pseudopilin PulG
MPRSRQTRRRTGYILLETVISGAIIATAVLSLLGQLSGARVAGIAAAREQTAARLVAAELERARAQASTIEPGVLRDQTVIVGRGSYHLVTTVFPEQQDNIPAPDGGDALTPRFFAVRAEVTFNVDNRERRAVANTRLYR